jgi:RNA 2',3'-cyclic 3'-phosphodiesterase
MVDIEHWRIFVAIELPANVRKQITEHIDHLRQAIPDARASWNRQENLHLTLKFLGDTPVTQVEALSQAVQRAAITVQPFELIVGGCGAFPQRGRPRVLWIGIEDPSGNLARLQQALEDECAKAGFKLEPRAFHPHLTIARIRKPEGSRELAASHNEIGFEPESVKVSEVTVIRSELLSAGSRYTVISRHEIGE